MLLQRVLAKESQFHLVEKELSKLKERPRNAENTKAEALAELEKACHPVDNLTQKLKIITESKEAAVKDTDSAKNQARELEEAKGDILGAVSCVHNHDLESAREQYSFSLSALNIAKQELVNIRQDFEAISPVYGVIINIINVNIFCTVS
ncbi:hypothetical protein Droror1_Dr00001154 [Drosera rotundifolia]